MGTMKSPTFSNSTQSSSTTRYQSYLVRLWRDSQHGAWRASARHVVSGEEVVFKDVEELVQFLRGVVDDEG